MDKQATKLIIQRVKRCERQLVLSPRAAPLEKLGHRQPVGTGKWGVKWNEIKNYKTGKNKG